MGDHYTPVKPVAISDGETADAADINNISDAVESAFETLEAEIDSIGGIGSIIASPGSSTDNGILIWDGASGTNVIESGWSIADDTYKMTAGGYLLTDFISGSPTLNTILGNNVCGAKNLTGINNVLIGDNVGYSASSVNFYTAVGSSAGYSGGGDYSVHMGAYAGFQNVVPYSVLLGFSAGYNTGGGTDGYDIAIGYNALKAGGGGRNVAIGYSAMVSAVFLGNNSVAIGYAAGNSITTGGSNVLIGYGAGGTLITAKYCVYLGYNISSTSPDDNYQLSIANLIFSTGGTFNAAWTVSDANVGIRSQSPAAQLDIVNFEGDNPALKLTCDDSIGGQAEDYIQVGAAGGVFRVEADGQAVMKNTLYCAGSDGTTGGAGSAGAGNQYVELDINGTVYKVLHDGTV